MTARVVQERLGSIRADIHHANGLLVRGAPDTFDRSTQILESASIELATVASMLSRADRNPDSLEEARRLQSEIRKTAALLEHASAFHLNWNRILAAMCGGYRAGGIPAPLLREGRLCIEA